jgi:hypothetical protein
VTVVRYAGPFIPVLVVRAPNHLLIPPAIYLLLSVYILVRATFDGGADQAAVDRR